MEQLVQRQISLDDLQGVPPEVRKRALYGQLMAYLSAGVMEIGTTPADIAAVGVLLSRAENPLMPGTLLGFLDGDGTPLPHGVHTMLEPDACAGTLVMIENEAPGTAPFRCPILTEALLPILVEDFPVVHRDEDGRETDVVRQRMTFTYQGVEYFASNIGMPKPVIFKIATIPVK